MKQLQTCNIISIHKKKRVISVEQHKKAWSMLIFQKLQCRKIYRIINNNGNIIKITSLWLDLVQSVLKF